MLPCGNRKVYIVTYVTIDMTKSERKILENVKLSNVDIAHTRILQLFFSTPDLEMSLNELSGKLKISKTTAKKVILELEKLGFIIKKTYGKTWSIRCNKQHTYNSTRKISSNLEVIFENYPNWRQQIIDIAGNPKAVILFGSYRKGDDTEDSDIDIAVEVSDNKNIRIVPFGIMPKFGYRKNVPVNLHIFSRNKIDINLFSNIANGIVLEGFLEVRP